MLEPMIVPMSVSTIDSVEMAVNVNEAVIMTLGSSVNMGGLVEQYKGSYLVTPKADEVQILETADKIMTDNVTVNKVPYYETSNKYGTTVYIASEAE